MVNVPENSKGFFRYMANWYDISRIHHFEIMPSKGIDTVSRSHYKIFAVYRRTGHKDYIETIMGYEQSKEFCAELIEDAVMSKSPKHQTNVFEDNLI